MTNEELLEIFKRANNPEINDLLNILQMRGDMPTFRVNPADGDGGSYHSGKHEVRIGPYGGNVGTVAHELSHALDRTMMNDVAWMTQGSNYNKPKTPDQQRFLDGYKKLWPGDTNLPLPKMQDANYRLNPKELRSFGVGNMALERNSPTTYPIGGHVDATMSTEAAILRDLYRRQIGQQLPKETNPFRNLENLLQSLFERK